MLENIHALQTPLTQELDPARGQWMGVIQNVAAEVVGWGAGANWEAPRG